VSPTRRALFARVSRETALLTPDIARAILRAFGLLAAELSETQLAEAIASGSVERLLTALLAPEVTARAFYPVREAIRRSVGRETRLFRRDLPRRARVAVGTVGIGFDVLNPRVIDAIRRLETRVITALEEGVRGAVRAHVEAGLAAGQGPRTIARGIRGVLRLSEGQVTIIQNLRRELEGGRFATAARRALLDKRFNLTNLGTLPAADRAARIDRIVKAYRESFVAHNAETIARTAALDSARLGQTLSWQDAIDKGYVDGANLVKQWVQIDRPTKREEHVPMHGEVVPFDQPYSNGQMIPGEGDYNCGCQSYVFVATGPRATAMA